MSVRVRRWRWLAWGGVATAVGCAGVLALGPRLLASPAREALDAALAERLQADVEVETLEVHVLRSFPRLGIALQGVRVTGRAPFAGLELAAVESVELQVGWLDVLSPADLTVRRLEVVAPRLELRVDGAGRASWDVLVDDGGASDRAYAVDLADLKVRDAAVTWVDEASGREVRLSDASLQAQALLSDQRRQLTASGTGALSVRAAGVDWLEDADVGLELEARQDTASGRVDLDAVHIALGALPLELRGWVQPEDSGYAVDLAFDAAPSSILDLLSLVPAAARSGLEGVESTGTLSASGTTRGTWRSKAEDLPAFEVTAELQDAAYRYPGQPIALERLAADVRLHHPEGPLAATELDVRRFAVQVAGETLEGALRIRDPLGDPHVRARAAGRIDLAKLRATLPPDAGDADAPEVRGQLDVALDVEGRMSDFEAGRTDDVRASGRVDARGLEIARGAWTPVDLSIADLELELTPRRAEVRTLQGTFGDSDFRVVGGLDNLLPWMLTDAELRGTLALTSKHLDLSPWQGDSASGTEDGAIAAVPQDLDLDLTAEVDQLRSQELDLDALRASLAVRGGELLLDRVRGSMLGGTVSLSGRYAAPTTEAAEIELDVETVRLDMAQTFRTFETLERIAPLLERAQGRFDSGIRLEARLGPDGAPVLESLASSGVISPSRLDVQAASLDALDATLDGGDWSTIDVGGSTLRYALREGRLSLRPVRARVGGTPATLYGTTGIIDHTLDLTLDLELDAARVRTAIAGAPAAVDVQVHIGGTWEKPKVRVGLEGLAEAVGDAAVAAAQAAGDLLVEEARAQADRIRAESRKAGKRLRTEARRAGDELVRAAGSNPLKVRIAQEGAKQLAKEADKAAKRVEREADKQADELVAAAETEREALVRRAGRSR